MMTEKKQMNKKAIIGIIAVVIVVAVMGILYSAFREKPVAGSKSITIEVVNQAGESIVYDVKTDAEYLEGAMADAEGLEFEGETTEYGLTISSINGEVADFNTSNSYWSFYVNGDYCNYGVSDQPVEDGDAFKIEYTVYVAQ